MSLKDNSGAKREHMIITHVHRVGPFSGISFHSSRMEPKFSKTASWAANAVQRNEPEEANTWDVNESEGVQSSRRCVKCEQCVCIEKRRKWFVFVLFPTAFVARLVVTVFQRWRPLVFVKVLAFWTFFLINCLYTYKGLNASFYM